MGHPRAPLVHPQYQAACSNSVNGQRTRSRLRDGAGANPLEGPLGAAVWPDTEGAPPGESRSRTKPELRRAPRQIRDSKPRACLRRVRPPRVTSEPCLRRHPLLHLARRSPCRLPRRRFRQCPNASGIFSPVAIPFTEPHVTRQGERSYALTAFLMPARGLLVSRAFNIAGHWPTTF